jgi:hypothetical protein
MVEKRTVGRPKKQSQSEKAPADTTVPKKHPGGQPTKYNPEWVETIPNMFSEGQSVLEVAISLGVCKDSLYEYAKLYPEFSDALSRGKAISQAWWERQGRENLYDTSEYDSENKISTTRKFNDRLWNKNVSCRFRKDWTDKSELEHSGSIGVQIIDDLK